MYLFFMGWATSCANMAGCITSWDRISKLFWILKGTLLPVMLELAVKLGFMNLTFDHFLKDGLVVNFGWLAA